MLFALYTLLGLATLVSGLAVILARRPARAGLALGCNVLFLAAIVLTLSAQFVAIAWAMVGLSIILLSLTILHGEHGSPEFPGNLTAKGSGRAALAVSLLLWVTLTATLFMSYAPGQVSFGGATGQVGEPTTIALAEVLFTRYSAGVVGMALILLVTLIGVRRTSRSPRGEKH